MRISDWSADVCSSDLSRGLICATTQVSDCPHLRRGTLKPMMRHAQDLPQRAIVWCRISDARDEDTTGVDDQEKHIRGLADRRSEEHTSELQSLMRISYAVFCLKKKKTQDMLVYHHICLQLSSDNNCSTLLYAQH